MLVETTGVTVLDGFCLAYVFFNRLDRVDLALYGSAVPGGMPIRGYVGFGRIENAAIELHGGPNRYDYGHEVDAMAACIAARASCYSVRDRSFEPSEDADSPRRNVGE